MILSGKTNKRGDGITSLHSHSFCLFTPFLSFFFTLQRYWIVSLVVILFVYSSPSYANKKLNRAYDQIILKNALWEGVEPALVHAVIRAESNYDTLAVSHKGAEGLMQLIPATAKRFKVKNSFVPSQNILGGTRYLSWLLKRFNGDMRLAVAGYNAGEGAVDKYNGIPPYRETQKYVKKVMRFYREFKGLAPINEQQIRRSKKVMRLIAMNKHSSKKRTVNNQKSKYLLALQQTNKVKNNSLFVRPLSRMNETVNTSGSVHRVTSLTLVNNDRPLSGYSRITAVRRLQ